MKPKAVNLVSGGLDSAVALAWTQARGYEACAIAFDYGQRHRRELEASEKVCRAAGVERRVTVKVDLGVIGGSALTGDAAVPRDRSEAEMPGGIPVTYVPARNLIFLSIAAAWAETLGATALVIGANAVDYSGYPDCRPEFLNAFQAAVDAGTREGVRGAAPRALAPLIDLTKADIVRLGVELGVDFSLTHSCYDPDPRGRACGRCDSCLLRKKGFREAGVKDPIPYAEG